jgi:outer membrane protein
MPARIDIAKARNDFVAERGLSSGQVAAAGLVGADSARPSGTVRPGDAERKLPARAVAEGNPFDSQCPVIGEERTLVTAQNQRDLESSVTLQLLNPTRPRPRSSR